MTPETVLLLEDEPFIALDLEELLFENGVENVVTLTSCGEALTWLRENTPGLVIVDPRLTDGLCSEVVRNLVTRRLPFLVYSGESGSLVEEEAAFGAGENIPKPSLPATIISAIERALKSTSGRAQSSFA